MDQLIEILKDAPIEVPDKSEPVPMREVMGEDGPVYAWLAANLYQSDPEHHVHPEPVVAALQAFFGSC